MPFDLSGEVTPVVGNASSSDSCEVGVGRVSMFNNETRTEESVISGQLEVDILALDLHLVVDIVDDAGSVSSPASRFVICWQEVA